MSNLALLGGKPVRTKLFAAYNTIGDEEKRAVMKVLDSGNLSQFLGAWHEDFFGGPNVRAFEAAWAAAFKAKYAVSVNSNTSGLMAAMGAAGVSPGDEVIVSPYSMSASAIAPLVYGGIPVFADIEDETFCMSVESIRKAITPRTKVILVVHIFGHPADMDPIMALAKEKGIIVVEDAAQAPGALYKGRPVGTLGDMGVFSLNYHKHIHTGEGGIVTTNSAELLERLQLIRNHGENIVVPKNVQGDLHNTWGFNFRMPEIEAAIGIEQLKKLEKLNSARIQIADEVTKRMSKYPGIIPPKVVTGCKHVYYQHASRLLAAKAGIKRDTFVKALRAELPSAELRETTPILGAGYVKPLYLLPVFQQKLAKTAFESPKFDGKVNYAKGLCPITERMHFDELFAHEYIRPSMTKADIDDVFRAFDKIFDAIPTLKDWEAKQ